jgi:serine/threonine protein kinase
MNDSVSAGNVDLPCGPDAPSETLADDETWTRLMLDRLRVVYEQDEDLAPAWSGEQEGLRRLLPELRHALSFNYEISDPLGVGGAGVVFRVRDVNLGLDRALKVVRPSPGKEPQLVELLEGERTKLLDLSHTNLVKVFAQGQAGEHPWYVMEYVPDRMTALEFFSSSHSEQEVLWFLWRVLDVVKYLHDNDVVHLDLKPGNILVRNGEPLVSDLGAAKHLRKDGQTLIVGTDEFLHPDMRLFMTEQESNDRNRRRGYAPRNLVSKTWDLYALGRTFNRLLDHLDVVSPRSLSPYAKRYLRLLSFRLLDGKELERERPDGLGSRSSVEIRYASAAEALRDLDKLVGRFQLEVEVPELNRYNLDTIQVSAMSPTVFSARIGRLVDSPTMLRLGATTQLGLLTLVYPTATHSRFEHSLGTYSICCEYVTALFRDELNPLFRQLMTKEDIEAVLLAALLHDIGQYPMAHDLEEVDKDLFNHDDLTQKYVVAQDIREAMSEDWSTSPERVAAILAARSGRGRLVGTIKDRILHSLVNGPIDADKIDYLTRDSAAMSLTYGAAIDLQRLLACLTVVYESLPNGETFASLGIHEKGRVMAESVAFARYAMHSQVYWHHAFRAIKAMVSAIVRSALSEAAKGGKGEVKSLMGEFRKMLTTGGNLSPSLQITSGPAGGRGGRISDSDRAILGWFSGRAEPWAREMESMIIERRLYRRLLVVAPGRSGASKLVDDAFEFGSKSWARQLELQRAFQAQVRQLVETGAGAAPTTATASPTARNAFLVASATMPILLVDIPPQKNEVPLEYVVEQGRIRSRLDGFSVGSLENSVIWGTIQSNFRKTAGKVRVYCHRSHADFLNSYLTRSQLEQAIEAAMEIVKDGDS